MKKVYLRPEVWACENIVSTKVLMVSSIGFWDDEDLPEGSIMGE